MDDWTSVIALRKIYGAAGRWVNRISVVTRGKYDGKNCRAKDFVARGRYVQPV